METIALDFTRLQTPAADGEVLVEPAPAGMRALLDATAALIDRWEVSLADRDLRSVRREVRRRVADVQDERPLVVTGHQPEFIHPGVWAKHIVAARLAEAADGAAVNLIVDTDAPRKTLLHVPTLGRERLGPGAVRFANIPAGVPYECIARYDAAAVDRLKRALAEALGPRYDRSMLGIYFEAFAGHAEPGDFVDQTVAGRSAIERRYGVTLIERRVSRVWFCPLLVEVLARAERFFDCYNAALIDYRRAMGIRGTHRPVPDLLRRETRFELPVWVQQADDPRSRLFVERRSGALHLFADRRSIGAIDSRALASWDSARTALDALDGVAFRPRALTLTLWARLLLADLFIHGIGGAKYDRITDLLIERYFGVTPPPMACVSATLRLDLPRREASPVTGRTLRHELRDLTYNPQRHLPTEGTLAELADARRRAVLRSRALRGQPGSVRSERRAVFREIRSLNAQMLAVRPDRATDLKRRIREVEKALQENAVALRRDYFFGMFDEPALEGLCRALPEVARFRI